MRTVTIRLNDDDYDKIEELRGETIRAVFCRELIENFLVHGAYNKVAKELQIAYDDLQREYKKILEEITILRELLKSKEAHMKDLQNQLGYMQFEYGKLREEKELLTQRLLPSPKVSIWKRLLGKE
jgi:predicted  nucleic acid-binding Zn-ribbon protein